MHATPASLLERLRQPRDTAAWGRFVELYSPLLYRWARHLGLQDSDGADLVQDVFLLLYRKLPAFTYDASKSFHAWLKTVFLNQYRLRLRKQAPLPLDNVGHELPATAEESFEEPEYRTYLIQQAFALIAQEFPPQQQTAFHAYVLGAQPPEEVAKALGLSPGAVYSIKSRILSRLRHELRGLLE